MQIDCEYLLFYTASETNKYSERKIYTETSKLWFGCYNLTRGSDTVVSSKNAYYDPSIEFYADDEKVLAALNESKEKLIQYYVTEE